MNVTLRLTAVLHEQLLEMSRAPLETAAVLLAHLVHAGEDNAVLLGTELLPVPDDAYEVRTDRSLQILSSGYVHALKAARDQGAVAIWVHTHPGPAAAPRPSRHDLVVNAQLDPLFADRTESDQYAYLVISPDNGGLAFTGALSGRVAGTITRLTAGGRGWVFRHSYGSGPSADQNLFDRNIRAFGDGIQATIGGLTVAVVGAGGTGSAVAEQLVRLGVRSFVLIDPDILSSSNTTRVYGSTPADVDRAKVDVLGDHLERIADGVRTQRLRGSILTEQTARTLVAADVVFGCTDDNAGRLRLSRLPYFYLTPVIDCGVQIPSAADGTISGIFGRVTTLQHGTACLVCRGRIDLALAEAETRSAEAQQELVKEGYAPALPGVEPAVVAFTTLVAATAVSELLERLVGYGDDPAPSELILYVHDRTVRGNDEQPRTGHYCDSAHRSVGSDRAMFLGLNWTS